MEQLCRPLTIRMQGSIDQVKALVSSPQLSTRLMVDAQCAASIAFLVLVRQRGRSRKCLCLRRTGNTSAYTFIGLKVLKPRSGLWARQLVVRRKGELVVYPWVTGARSGGLPWPTRGHPRVCV